MANILYGVNGEGSGHSARSREVLRHLKERGHNLHVVSFDRGQRDLKPEFEVTEIYGLRFAYVENRVRYGRTVGKNLLRAPRALRSLRLLNKLADRRQINFVITDFEPLSARLARHRHLPLICIDNQHCLTNAQIDYPRRYRREAATAKLVTRLMVPRARAYFVTSFFTPPVKKKNTFFFPPILRREVLAATAGEGDDVLVYLTSPSTEVAELLRQVRAKFVCYGFGRSGQEGNLTFKPPGLDTFLRDLAGTKAIIANAGFSLISEALYLRKPYLAIPVKHQFEQTFNAYWLQKMGYGAYWEELNRERIDSFLFNLDAYREKLSLYPQQDNNALFQKIDALIAKTGPGHAPLGMPEP